MDGKVAAAMTKTYINKFFAFLLLIDHYNKTWAYCKISHFYYFLLLLMTPHLI